jgi:hypothetical protein
MIGCRDTLKKLRQKSIVHFRTSGRLRILSCQSQWTSGVAHCSSAVHSSGGVLLPAEAEMESVDFEN